MQTVTCVAESSYAGALTRGAVYEVLAADERKRQLRVRDDRGRARWYPSSCFADKGTPVPQLAGFTLDDPIRDPTADWVEVTATLTNGEQRWCAFTTPAHLARVGDELEAEGRPFRVLYGVPHMVVLSQLSEAAIAATLRHLDGQGVLEHCSLGLSPADERAP